MAKPPNPDLVALATERGIEVNPGMDTSDLMRLLGPTPPSDLQIAYISDLATYLGYPGCPPLRTFSHARTVIGDLEDIANARTIERYQWQEELVICWRDLYWKIVELHPSRLFHRLSLIRVTLEPDGNGGAKAVKVPGRREIHGPFTMQGEKARTVDLSTWPPTLIELPAP